MLFRNDVFILDGKRYRLLDTAAVSNTAWTISLEAQHPWPQAIAWSDVSTLHAEVASNAPTLRVTKAMKDGRDAAMERVAPLVAAVPDIFDKTNRHRLVEARAAECGCSERTLHKDLRRFWQGGQTPSALFPDFHRCGRKETDITAGRGGKTNDGREIYQLTALDIEQFKEAIETEFLKDARISIAAAFQKALDKHYVTLDGNGKPYILPFGSRPTLRQFRHYLRQHYSEEVKIRGRDGDKVFEKDHAPKLGTVLSDCLGVGHYYEIDATIVDIYAVLEADRNRIVGKPTLFLVCDRASNLIVGFYLGLENPSWVGAMQAILSIAQDKAALCAFYGVPYDPEDWPADRVFPKQFLADRGEMLAKASSYVADDLHIGVTNLPAQSPQKKPLIECDFKLIHESIKDIAPAYEPQSEVHRRCGKHYEKDATLSVHEIGNLILNAIVLHNRKRMLDYNLSLKQLARRVLPSPIALWNDGIVERSGLLTRFDESHVRHALLSKDTASVTDEGILFRGCHYTCPEALAHGWFVKARKKRFRVTVSFDSRLVDSIFVHGLAGTARPFEATLTARSEKYRGLSFAEVKVYETLKAAMKPDIEQSRSQEMLEFHQRVKPVVEHAEQEYAKQRTKSSRKARRADVKVDRHTELQAERQRLAAATQPASADVPPQRGEVVQLARPRPKRTETAPPSSSTGSTTDVDAAAPTPTAAQLLQEARKRMLHG